jgi:hypothetical protein
MKDTSAKMPKTVQLVAPVFVIGLCFGVSIGLYVGWIALPQLGNVDISNLKATSQDDYIALVARTYAYDQDLDLARERLAQLKDSKILERVANLALTYAGQNKSEAAQIASLALALGSRDDEVAIIAMTPSAALASLTTPTSTATLVVPVGTTPTSTQINSGNPINTPTRRPSGVIATRTVQLTRTAIPAPIAPTTFLPTSFGNWPGGFRVDPANVPAGQQYWHLTRAIYCDYPETQYGCKEGAGYPTLPGGQGSIGVWVTLVGGKAPLILDDKLTALEDKSADTQCQCTYSLDFPGPSIQVSNYPSDKIIGAANTGAKTGFPNQHVRYFFTFQLMTR